MPRPRLAAKWLVLIAVTLGMFMSLLDDTIVNVMIPQLQRSFGTSVQSVQWVVTVYMLTQAAVSPTAPYLAARFGSARAYFWSLAAFVAGSLLCGLAWSLPSLVVARLIQGIGGGILLPLVMTLLYQSFAPNERGSASSTMGMAMMVAPMLGPLLGGYFVSAFSWHIAFLINLPLGAVALLIIHRTLPRGEAGAGADAGSFDMAGFATIATSSVLLLYGISTLDLGSALGRNLAVLAGGMAMLAWFVAIERGRTARGQQPLLDLRAFSDATFSRSTVAHGCMAFARFGVLFLFPIYLQTQRGLSPFTSGALLTSQAVATMIFLPLAGRLADRVGARPVALAGIAGAMAALALMAALGPEAPYPLIGGVLFLMGGSFGCVQQLPVAAMANTPAEEHAAVAHGSTLLSVIHATAAPLGVGALSTLMQIFGQHAGALAGFHRSALVAATVATAALLLMLGAPARRAPNVRVQLPN